MMTTVLAQHLSEFTRALTANSPGGEDEFVPRIKSSSRISPQLALEIYRNNTRGSRTKAMEMIYPACKRILGSDTFQAVASGYVIEDSIGAADLNHYGETFRQYLGALVDAGRLADDYAYLPDLASLEFKFHAAYYADPDPVFDFERFEQKVKNGEPIYLQLSASLGMLASLYPLYQIWLHNHPGLETANNKGNSEHDVEAITTSQYLLIHRDEYIPAVTPASVDEYRLLEAMDSNQSLQAVLDRIDCDINVVLPKLIANKYIVGIKHNE